MFNVCFCSYLMISLKFKLCRIYLIIFFVLQSKNCILIELVHDVNNKIHLHFKLNVCLVEIIYYFLSEFYYFCYIKFEVVFILISTGLIDESFSSIISVFIYLIRV